MLLSEPHEETSKNDTKSSCSEWTALKEHAVYFTSVVEVDTVAIDIHTFLVSLLILNSCLKPPN